MKNGLWSGPVVPGDQGKTGSVVIELGDGLTDGGLVEQLLLIQQARHQSRGADLIDAARQAFGVLVDSGDGIVSEEWPGGIAGGTDVMPDIADGLGQIERAKVV